MTRKVFMRLLLVVASILLIDVVSKGLTSFYLQPMGLSSPFFPFGGVSIFKIFGIDFCIHHVTNKGFAWGLGSDLQGLIMLLRIAIIVGIVVYMKRAPAAFSQRYPLAMIVAGGIGNIIDYFIYGHVIDMFHFIFWGYSYPVFNVADASIFFGIAAILWKSWKNSRQSDALPQSN